MSGSVPAAPGARVPRVTDATWVAARLLFPPLFFWPMRLRRRGRHHIPRRGAVLVVCNHVSYRDPPLMGGAVLPRRLYYMAKKELFRRRSAAAIISRLGAFPVDRGGADREAIRVARTILARGDALLMFPEGTRSAEGRLRPGLPGAGALALEPGVTVVPAAIWGSQRRLGPVRVVFGPPLDLADLAQGPRSRRAQAAADRMMQAVAELLPQAGGPAQEAPVTPRAVA